MKAAQRLIRQAGREIGAKVDRDAPLVRERVLAFARKLDAAKA